MTETFQAQIDTALRSVPNPRLGTDVVAGEMVRDIATTVAGKVRLTLILEPEDDATIARDVRVALERIAGTGNVRVDIADASMRPRASGAASVSGGARAAMDQIAENYQSTVTRKQKARALPVMDTTPSTAQRSTPPAPTPKVFPSLGKILAVSSGKGGVGKSTVATNLAVALARSGARVALMDADIYGPNIPRMMGVNSPPPVVDGKIIPLEAHGVKFISLGVLIERDQPAIWRGPIVMKIITQFLTDVNWGEIDYFLVDMPPGTGDAQLSLVQAAQIGGAVIVTTPQDVAVGDALRGAKMFQRVGVPVLGIIENMSWFECPHCGKPTPLFGTGGGRRLADELALPLLGEIPLYAAVLTGGDAGAPIVIGEPRSAAARALVAIADLVKNAFELAAPR
ncbi:MAG: hypothetical protein NVS1B4_08950 [Gemmatimonadaceae bacterium]